ncbi:uncharacterized protein LOC108912898 [Anoplophora glabripennis]|uniref:uncharacterized protein LOC108912898 n=1 Tax=Anoplophora glabripennis TaxID=217634 RepID=UPI0008750B59|nr:uncharacterized protein LOC108912898 [Anoplophora glabripennis]
MEKIVKAEVHRLVVVDDEEKVIGIISLSDLLLYLVLKPCGEEGDSGNGTISVRDQDYQKLSGFGKIALVDEASDEKDEYSEYSSRTAEEHISNIHHCMTTEVNATETKNTLSHDVNP